ncbi:hypothetical protein CRUP_028023 [Coryphaenoides rupestris]|nr:hypothetical protein CRUP_028023 [Coryphaenoides rupestris]
MTDDLLTVDRRVGGGKEESQGEENQEEEEEEEEEEEGEEMLGLYLRERSHYRDYGSGSSSYGTSLFGHPLLLRYVRPPDPSDEVEEEEEEEVYKTQTNGISDDEEGEENGETAGSSQQSDGRAVSQPDATPLTTAISATNRPQPSLDSSSEEMTNHSPAACSSASSGAKANASGETIATSNASSSQASSSQASSSQASSSQASSSQASSSQASSSQASGSAVSAAGETAEEDKQEEACSPIPAVNEQPVRRKLCRKKRRSLFTIQAVNSNGTTERGKGGLA